MHNTNTSTDSKSAGWQVLKDLASNTKKSSEAAKILRSNTTDGIQVLALFKLAASMEEPFKSKARSELGKVSSFQKCRQAWIQ